VITETISGQAARASNEDGRVDVKARHVGTSSVCGELAIS